MPDNRATVRTDLMLRTVRAGICCAVLTGAVGVLFFCSSSKAMPSVVPATEVTEPDEAQPATADFQIIQQPEPVPAAIPMPPSPIEAAAAQQAQREAYEIDLLAKLMYGEARGIPSEAEMAAVAWCALNRVDSKDFPNTVEEVVTQPHQFDGFSYDHPVQSHLRFIAVDVYGRWKQLCAGISVDRVLPPDYFYFYGDGVRNYFTQQLGSSQKWDFSLHNPYPAMRRERLRKYEPTEVEVFMIAQVIWASARNVESEMQQAAVAWCVMNRVASGLFPDTVKEVIEQSKQFDAYDPYIPVTKPHLAIAKDVVKRWTREMRGETEVGRVLPSDYLYFNGNGKVNKFSKTYPVRSGWNWSYDDPYQPEG